MISMGKEIDMKRDSRCYHFTGITNDTCEIGLNYKEITGGGTGWGAKIPCCINSLSKDPVTCDKFRERTAEELKEEEKTFKNEFNGVMVARAHIVKMIEQHKVSRGKTKCPVCDGGFLAFSQASNGHIHASCSTTGCVSWME